MIVRNEILKIARQVASSTDVVIPTLFYAHSHSKLWIDFKCSLCSFNMRCEAPLLAKYSTKEEIEDVCFSLYERLYIKRQLRLNTICKHFMFYLSMYANRKIINEVRKKERVLGVRIDDVFPRNNIFDLENKIVEIGNVYGDSNSIKRVLVESYHNPYLVSNSGDIFYLDFTKDRSKSVIIHRIFKD